MKNHILSAIEASPIIAAVKNYEGLARILASDLKVIFVLYGDLCSIAGIVDRLRDAGKYPIVHADLITGLGSKEVAVDFLAQSGASGIISTRPNVIHYARQCGLLAIQRFFVIDSRALETACRQLASSPPDVAEILPGVMPPTKSRCTTAFFPAAWMRETMLSMSQMVP